MRFVVHHNTHLDSLAPGTVRDTFRVLWELQLEAIRCGVSDYEHVVVANTPTGAIDALGDCLMKTREELFEDNLHDHSDPSYYISMSTSDVLFLDKPLHVFVPSIELPGDRDVHLRWKLSRLSRVVGFYLTDFYDYLLSHPNRLYVKGATRGYMASVRVGQGTRAFVDEDTVQLKTQPGLLWAIARQCVKKMAIVGYIMSLPYRPDGKKTELAAKRFKTAVAIQAL